MRRVTNGELILPDIQTFHFPTRWKYDVLRALLYFAESGVVYDKRMDEAMELLSSKFRRGYLLRGAAYPGREHFRYETTRAGAMNTLRGLIVLKAYDPDLYRTLLRKIVVLPD